MAGRHTEATARFGALIVNLADAVLPGREITLDINAFCSKAIITVPENARVVDEGGVLFGKRVVTAGNAPAGAEEGPLIRITGKSRVQQDRGAPQRRGRRRREPGDLVVGEPAPALSADIRERRTGLCARLP